MSQCQIMQNISQNSVDDPSTELSSCRLLYYAESTNEGLTTAKLSIFTKVFRIPQQIKIVHTMLDEQEPIFHT